MFNYMPFSIQLEIVKVSIGHVHCLVLEQEHLLATPKVRFLISRFYSKNAWTKSRN